MDDRPGQEKLGQAHLAGMGEQFLAARPGMLRHQQELLALSRIGQGDHRMPPVGPEGCDRAFDRGQRDHLAADLGEALEAAEDGDETAGIDADDIAGVVDAGFRRLQPAGRLGPEIAQHEIRPFQDQPAAFGHAGHRLQAPVDAGDESTRRARLELHGCIDGDHRRHLRGAIALQYAQAEFLRPGGSRLRAHPLGPGEDVAQAVEVIGIGGAGIAGEEGIGAEEDGGVGIIGELRHEAVMQRRGVEEGLHPGQQRQQQPAGEAEGMEDRQGVEHHVSRVEIEQRAHLIAIGQDIGVAQHHALGRALRA